MAARADVAEIKRVAIETGKSADTIRRWAKRGCDLNNPESIREFVLSGRVHYPRNIPKSSRRNKPTKDLPQESEKAPASPVDASESDGGRLYPTLESVELGEPGQRGAEFALARLEAIEEEAHRRLERALAVGNAYQIKAAQEFFLRSSESLRRLDLSIEVERRNSEQQIPIKQAEETVLYVADWLRIAFMQFLSSESRTLMGFKDLGEFKLYAVNRFIGILHLAVKSSLKTNSAIPAWAASKIVESWNVSDL